jgi:hypothetical protein
MESFSRFESKSTESSYEHAMHQLKLLIPPVNHKLLIHFLLKSQTAFLLLDISAPTQLNRVNAPVPNEYTVHIVNVQDRLSKIKQIKAVGPDRIPNKILKQTARIVGPPLAANIICSLQQDTTPDVWKLSRTKP